MRRLDQQHVLQGHIVAEGKGGLKSSNLILQHKKAINSLLPSADKCIIHIGSNDISKFIPGDQIVKNVTKAGKHLQVLNPKVTITVSSIFVQKYDTPKNLIIVETNAALRRLCLTQGWDFLEHGNIGFKHLDKGGMHLTP